MNYEPEQTHDYTNFDDDTLQQMFDSAETDSAEYNAIMAELSKRGYSFTPDDNVEHGELPETKAGDINVTGYTKLGSRIWNIASLLISAIGVAFFIQQLSQFGKVEIRLYILGAAIAAIIVSLSYLVSGIRHLANLRLPQSSPSPSIFIEYAVLTLLWLSGSAFGLYSAIRSFLHYQQLGLTIAIYIAIPALVIMVFAFGLAAAFFYLAKELRR